MPNSSHNYRFSESLDGLCVQLPFHLIGFTLQHTTQMTKGYIVPYKLRIASYEGVLEHMVNGIRHSAPGVAFFLASLAPLELTISQHPTTSQPFIRNKDLALKSMVPLSAQPCCPGTQRDLYRSLLSILLWRSHILLRFSTLREPMSIPFPPLKRTFYLNNAIYCLKQPLTILSISFNEPLINYFHPFHNIKLKCQSLTTQRYLQLLILMYITIST